MPDQLDDNAMEHLVRSLTLRSVLRRQANYINHRVWEDHDLGDRWGHGERCDSLDDPCLVVGVK